MRDLDIISHHEMCLREGMMLQRGMYFRPEAPHSVLLMSRRRNAPYEHEMPDDSTIIYEGHDAFHLVNSEFRDVGRRKVFKFTLLAVPEESDEKPPAVDAPHRRLIPSWVKQAVFKRDKGRCTLCGSKENIHYDHELPVSKGGSSLTTKNIRILCGKHNLQKRDKIE